MQAEAKESLRCLKCALQQEIFVALPPLQGGQTGHQAPETARRSLGPAGHCRPT